MMDEKRQKVIAIHDAIEPTMEAITKLQHVCMIMLKMPDRFDDGWDMLPFAIDQLECSINRLKIPKIEGGEPK